MRTSASSPLWRASLSLCFLRGLGPASPALTSRPTYLVTSVCCSDQHGIHADAIYEDSRQLLRAKSCAGCASKEHAQRAVWRCCHRHKRARGRASVSPYRLLPHETLYSKHLCILVDVHRALRFVPVPYVQGDVDAGVDSSPSVSQYASITAKMLLQTGKGIHQLFMAGFQRCSVAGTTRSQPAGGSGPARSRVLQQHVAQRSLQAAFDVVMHCESLLMLNPRASQPIPACSLLMIQ